MSVCYTIEMILDGYTNLLTGSGVTGCDKGRGGHYASRFTPEQYWTMYEESWCSRRVVDIKVADTLREWRVWGTNQEAVTELEENLNIRQLVQQALTAARVTGGAALYIGQQNISSEALAEPLDVDSVKPGEVTYLTLFDRTELSVIDYDEDPFSARYKKGTTYSINRGNHIPVPVHFSRFIWFEGNFVSHRTREAQQGWGDSVYNGLEELIQAADSAILELRALIPEAKVDVFGIESLAEMVENKTDEELFMKRMRIASVLKATQQALVIDKNDTYEQKTLSFTGVTDASKAVLQTLAGASDIPVTRFMGVSPGGLNATGESDLRNYYDGLAAYQNSGLRRELLPIDTLLLRLSGIAGKPDYTWNSLWQLTAQETAEVGNTEADTLNKLSSSMLLDTEFLSILTKHTMLESVAFNGIEQALEDYGRDELQFEGLEETEETGNPEEPDESDEENGA